MQGHPQDLAGGGGNNFFSDLEICMLSFARGVRGYAPRENFLKWCIFVYILIRFCLKFF